jgi:hypothetical protein
MSGPGPNPNGSVQGTPGGQDGDLSVAVGQSGTFYVSFIHFQFGPNSVGIATAQVAGANPTFSFKTDAKLCKPNDGCSIDQPHIAADHVNAPAGGKDRLYVTWRFPASIACSSDGGATWSTPFLLGGDFPRATVGPDGRAYALYSPPGDPRNVIYLQRFSACTDANRLVALGGAKVVASGFRDSICPVSGLDRCNAGTWAPNAMVSVDDRDPRRLYVAYASTSASGNDDIRVLVSTNNGDSFDQGTRVSSSVRAHRFLPWVCATDGSAFVSWYDRSTATATANDLTNYLVASVSGLAGAGPALNLSVNPDPQCATKFPAGADVDDVPALICSPPQFIGTCSASNASCSSACPNGETCRVPAGQQAGSCQNSLNTGSSRACRPCPQAAESCNVPGPGVPKYGDYNGNACAAGRFFGAWASATAPPGVPAVPPVGGVPVIRIFSDALRVPHWSQEEDLGGVLSSAPTAASWGNNRLDIFYPGQNNHLWHRAWDGAQWNNEEDLGGVLSTGPGAVSWGFNRIDVFYRGQNNHLWHRSWDGAQWNNEEDLGGVLTSEPTAAAWGNNRLDVFYPGQNNHLWHRAWDGAQWDPEEDLGGVLTSAPGAVSWGQGRIDVFYRGQNNHLWHRSFG